MPLLETLRIQSLSAALNSAPRAWWYSLGLHALVIAASLVVLPRLTPPLDAVPPPMIVDVVKVSDITNLPPPPTRPQPLKTDITSQPLPEPKAEPKFAPKAAAPEPAPAPAPKPAVTPPPPQAEPKPKAEANDFDAVLKTVEKFKPKAAETPEPAPVIPAETKSTAPGQAFIPSLPISVSEIDALRQQIGQCWNLPAGARQPEELIVEVWVALNPDGTLREAKVLDNTGRASRDGFYRAAAEAALRALMNPRCQPLKLPPEKYHQWQTMTINFDPRYMLGL